MSADQPDRFVPPYDFFQYDSATITPGIPCIPIGPWPTPVAFVLILWFKFIVPLSGNLWFQGQTAGTMGEREIWLAYTLGNVRNALQQDCL
jgi:hypothetical protein